MELLEAATKPPVDEYKTSTEENEMVWKTRLGHDGVAKVESKGRATDEPEEKKHLPHYINAWAQVAQEQLFSIEHCSVCGSVSRGGGCAACSLTSTKDAMMGLLGELESAPRRRPRDVKRAEKQAQRRAHKAAAKSHSQHRKPTRVGGRRIRGVRPPRRTKQDKAPTKD